MDIKSGKLKKDTLGGCIIKKLVKQWLFFQKDLEKDKFCTKMSLV